jgi:hypothetical protein
LLLNRQTTTIRDKGREKKIETKKRKKERGPEQRIKSSKEPHKQE